MLQELSIKNFAVIKAADIHFKEGMTVFTGETGAGKSIIIDAVGLLSGGRGSAQYVRHGEEKCQLQALFIVKSNHEKIKSILEENDIDFESRELLIQRDIYKNGRQVSRINGSIVTISLLRELGSFLVDIQGQNEHQELMNAENHILLLDRFGGDSFLQNKKNYAPIYQNYLDKKRVFNNWQNNEQEMNQRIDMLAFQLKELEEASLVDGEEEELEQERLQLMNYQNVMKSLSDSYQLITGNDEHSSVDFIGRALEQIESISELSEDYQVMSQKLSGIYYELQDLISNISNQINDLDYDEERLNEIEERLNTIHLLKRKYGSTISEILNFYEQAKQEYMQLTQSEEDVSHLEEEILQLEKEVLEAGRALSIERRQLAEELEENIHQELSDLYMEKAVFKVNFPKDLKSLTIEDTNYQGLDRVSFLIATNPGEPLKALENVASGGELSRMMLAMKTIFTKKQTLSTNILDEVDTGVSGRVATAIAEKISMISKHNQVLCITHLPQVAATADHHLYISKEVKEGRTSTSVKYLEEDEKIKEIAEMLAGSELSEHTLITAQELRQSKLN